MLNIDIGCGGKVKTGFIGMDIRPLEGVEYVHDLEVTPWPFQEGIISAINASHVLEHIKPWKIIEVMNEAWRVLEVGGGMDVRIPYGLAYKLNPTHCIEWCVPTFWYFDVTKDFYKTYKPNPWKIIHTESNPETMEIRVILQKEAL